MKKLSGVAIGAGYFSEFHYEAWNRLENVQLKAVCDLDLQKASAMAKKFNIEQAYHSFEEMLESHEVDFVDIITPPDTHFELVKMAAAKGLAIICQKPLAPTFEEAVALVKYCQEAGVRLMVHENFRFQPWHRELKKLLNRGVIGELNHIVHFCRMGDGWGKDAYLGRQPYFRDYKRLLIYETGIHFIDIYRYLGGEIDDVFARLRRLNPVIKGEDSGLLSLTLESGAWVTCDFSRYNESNAENARYTFGQFTLEGTLGTIRLYPNGELTIQKLGAKEVRHEYQHENRGFAGDCVFTTQKHFIECLLSNQPFETSGEDYLKSLAIQEQVYKTAK